MWIELPKGGQRFWQHHQIDVGFVGLRSEHSAHGLLFESMAYDSMLLAIPARHPLAKKPKIRLADLASQFFIGMSAKSQPGSREWLLETCERAGFGARILQEADNEPTAIKFVAAGLGVAFLPEQVHRLPHQGVIFSALHPALRRESTVAWHADNPAKAIVDYIQIVKDVSRKMSSAAGRGLERPNETPLPFH